jgi:hypothetical protein
MYTNSVLGFACWPPRTRQHRHGAAAQLSMPASIYVSRLHSSHFFEVEEDDLLFSLLLFVVDFFAFLLLGFRMIASRSNRCNGYRNLRTNLRKSRGKFSPFSKSLIDGDDDGQRSQ